MTQEEINKAFEGRWRLRGEPFRDRLCGNTPSLREVELERVKELCREFFETGVILSQRTCEYCDTIHPSIPEVSTKDPVEGQFELWWKMYDKKCGRADCLKKWKKLTFDERIDCMNATPDYVASTPDKQYRKNPLSYLNQKAWNDEIILRINGADNQPSKQQQDLNKLASILTD